MRVKGVVSILLSAILLAGCGGPDVPRLGAYKEPYAKASQRPADDRGDVHLMDRGQSIVAVQEIDLGFRRACIEVPTGDENCNDYAVHLADIDGYAESTCDQRAHLGGMGIEDYVDHVTALPENSGVGNGRGEMWLQIAIYANSFICPNLKPSPAAPSTDQQPGADGAGPGD